MSSSNLLCCFGSNSKNQQISDKRLCAEKNVLRENRQLDDLNVSQMIRHSRGIDHYEKSLWKNDYANNGSLCLTEKRFLGSDIKDKRFHHYDLNEKRCGHYDVSEKRIKYYDLNKKQCGYYDMHDKQINHYSLNGKRCGYNDKHFAKIRKLDNYQAKPIDVDNKSIGFTNNRTELCKKRVRFGKKIVCESMTDEDIYFSCDETIDE